MVDSTDANVRQVLTASQALRLAQPTGKYQDAVMALCAACSDVASTRPGHKGLQSPGRVATSRALTRTNIVCSLVPPAINAAPLHNNTFCTVMRAFLASYVQFQRGPKDT